MFRRAMVLSVLATTFSLWGAFSPAGASVAGRVTGGGTIIFGPNSIDVTVGVIGNPGGTQGTVAFSAGAGTLQETLTASCLNVNGTLATIRATVVSSFIGGPPVGEVLIIFVEDNGGPHSSPPDAIAQVGSGPYGPGCAFPPNPGETFLPLATGNLVVSSS